MYYFGWKGSTKLHLIIFSCIYVSGKFAYGTRSIMDRCSSSSSSNRGSRSWRSQTITGRCDHRKRKPLGAFALIERWSRKREKKKKVLVRILPLVKFARLTFWANNSGIKNKIKINWNKNRTAQTEPVEPAGNFHITLIAAPEWHACAAAKLFPLIVPLRGMQRVVGAANGCDFKSDLGRARTEDRFISADHTKLG